MCLQAFLLCRLVKGPEHDMGPPKGLSCNCKTRKTSDSCFKENLKAKKMAEQAANKGKLAADVCSAADSNLWFNHRTSCFSNNSADCLASPRHYPAIKAPPPSDLSNQLSSISELCKFISSLSSPYKQITAR